RLADDLQLLQRAAQTAYETATHEENIAENKYDTLGLDQQAGRFRAEEQPALAALFITQAHQRPQSDAAL
ncbi:transcription elongation factor GreAB, partial [Pseudomonas otitidis]|nr:transcription elongation factor GreAB [Pseudomonas otitidis]